MANFCEKCGQPLIPDSRFCTRCGNATSNAVERQPVQMPAMQNVNQAEATVRTKKSNGVFKAVIAVLLVVVIALGGILAYQNFADDKPEKNDITETDDLEETTNKTIEQDITLPDVVVPEVTKPDVQPERIIVGTGGHAGTYYAFLGVVGSILSDEKIEFNVISTGGSQDNIEMIDDGEAQMAIVQNDVANYAYEGVNSFGSSVTSFSAIGTMYPEVCQIVARKDSGITAITDLKGKNVVVGDVGSGVYYNAQHILAAAGLDIDKDINKITASFVDSADKLIDGKIDAIFITAGTPNVAVTELATNIDIVMVELGEDVVSNLAKESGYYVPYTIRGGTYDFVSEPVNTVAIKSMFIVSKKLSDDTVYEIVKDMWESKDKIAMAHAKGAEMDVMTTLDGLGEIPLHPGAERYYREKGIIQ